jgi:hypothetical protein
MTLLPLVLPSSWVPPLRPTGCYLGPASPVVVPRCLAYLVLQIGSAMARLQHVPPPPRPSANAEAALPADSDDEVLSPRGTHHPPLASFDGDDALLSLSRLSRLYSYSFLLI